MIIGLRAGQARKQVSDYIQLRQMLVSARTTIQGDSGLEVRARSDPALQFSRPCALPRLRRWDWSSTASAVVPPIPKAPLLLISNFETIPVGPERAPCADVHKIASAHLANVRKKLSDLVKLEAILAETVAQCSDGATPD